MVTFRYTVSEEHGIHARPAGMLVRCAQKYTSKITLKANDKSADAKRLISVMSLGAKKGDSLVFEIEGPDPAAERQTADELLEYCRGAL